MGKHQPPTQQPREKRDQSLPPPARRLAYSALRRARAAQPPSASILGASSLGVSLAASLAASLLAASLATTVAGSRDSRTSHYNAEAIAKPTKAHARTREKPA